MPGTPMLPRRLRSLLGSGVSLVIGVMTACLIGAFATKAGCLHTAKLACYSDIHYLWSARDLGAHTFPYIHGRYLSEFGFVVIGRGEIEYPVLTGLFAWVAALPVRTVGGFMVANALMLAPLGLLAAWVLHRLVGRRALLFVASPAVVFYGFLNWDLLAVALAMLGVWAWWRNHPYLAATALALGGCAKVWPALLMVPIVLELWLAGRRRTAVQAGAVCGGVALLINLPFMLANFQGWYAPYAFQALRPVDSGTNSIWYYAFPQLTGKQVSDISEVLTLALIGAIALYGVRRSRTSGSLPVLQMSTAMVFAFVVCGKAFSPQYALWLLPFFALVRIRWQLWLAFLMTDTLMYVAWFAHPLGPTWLGVATFSRLAIVLLAGFDALHTASPLDRPLESARRSGIRTNRVLCQKT